MARNPRNSLGVLTAAMLYLFHPWPVMANTPMEAIRSTADGVLGVLKDPALKSPEQSRARRDKLREIIYPTFDFEEMAKRSLGAHWSRQGPEERRTFVKLFTNLLEGAYADSINSYQGEKIVYGQEKTDKNFAEVSTMIVTKKGEEYSANYKLHNREGQWKVYDVVIENISLVNNYRSQFSRVLGRSSFAELLERMKAKQFDSPSPKKKT